MVDDDDDDDDDDDCQERELFELPEKEKMVLCERHRLRGNFLFGEGVLVKAAEQYKTV